MLLWKGVRVQAVYGKPKPKDSMGRLGHMFTKDQKRARDKKAMLREKLQPLCVVQLCELAKADGMSDQEAMDVLGGAIPIEIFMNFLLQKIQPRFVHDRDNGTYKLNPLFVSLAQHTV